MNMYRVNYQVPGEGFREDYLPENWTINDVLSGFWINDKYKITNGSDCRFFILPHHINFIVKDSDDEGGKDSNQYTDNNATSEHKHRHVGE